MQNSHFIIFQDIYSICRQSLGKIAWGEVLAALDDKAHPRDFPDALVALSDSMDFPAFISDLAHIEWAWHNLKKRQIDSGLVTEKLIVNPSLEVIPVSWKNLASQDNGQLKKNPAEPELTPTHIMIWRHTKTGEITLREAEDIDLLALKIIIDDIDPRRAADMGNVHVNDVHTAINRAVNINILVSPGSRIIRHLPADKKDMEKFFSPFITAETFTLQWHVTQACDLHCKHCYDRSDRSPMAFATALHILDDFYEFCRLMHVNGHISFTGGNPLLYPRFLDLYRAATDMGFSLAVLGNPGPEKQIEKLVKIKKPSYFQISLEGLAEHNDYIRGSGHFNRSMDFLKTLRKMDIFSMVMLTLTRANLDQVLPLEEILESRADYFTFNRLATVGEAAALRLPEKNNFEKFLRKYEAVSTGNRLMGIKDNLFNIIREEKKTKPFGGCTGFGCGAAFNFVALLPDGEVHACRKFPSPLGNMFNSTLSDIYQSELAQKYRNGPTECKGCRIWPVCRGCLANIYSHGKNVFTHKDPFCFIKT